MNETTFNGVSLFANYTTATGVGNEEVLFNGSTVQDNTVSIFTSPTGESGSLVSINKSMLLSALTIDADASDNLVCKI